jgi:hypothetical protein
MDDPDRPGAAFLLIDLELANTFLDIADTAHGETRERNIVNAWTAHNSITNLSSRDGLTDSELLTQYWADTPRGRCCFDFKCSVANALGCQPNTGG